MVINVDFDNSCVVEDENGNFIDIGAAEVLKELVENGHKLILFTCRSNKPYIKHHELHADELNEALQWFRDNDIELYGIQSNPDQRFWTDSPKSHADLSIDDTNLGCPLKYDEDISDRSFVDWNIVRQYLTNLGAL